MSFDSALVAHAVAAKASAGGREWVRINCPCCEIRTGKPDRKSSMGVNTRTGKYSCFRCAVRGDLESLDFFEEMRRGEPALDADPTPELPESFVELSTGALCVETARRYVKEKRGLSDNLIAEARIGACTTGRFAGRVVIPLFDLDDDLRWFIARSWGEDAERPYLYPRGGRGDILYNERALFIDSPDPVIVVEGAFDALHLWPNAVAVLGKPTPAHLEKLAGCHRPVAFCLDGDAHDEAWAYMMQLKLRGKEDVGTVKFPPRADPDEFPRGYVEELCVLSVETGEVDISDNG